MDIIWKTGGLLAGALSFGLLGYLTVGSELGGWIACGLWCGAYGLGLVMSKEKSRGGLKK